MSSKVERLEANKVKIEITVSAKDFTEAVDKAFKKNASKIAIPGFRKGKAPRNVIERTYGKEVMYEEHNVEDADVLLLAFGTMGRNIKAAMNEGRAKGLKIGTFRPITLFPFPNKRLSEIADKTKKIIVAEMNMGQMLKDVQLAVLSNAQIAFVGKPVGDWLKEEEMIGAINNIIKERYASI